MKTYFKKFSAILLICLLASQLVLPQTNPNCPGAPQLEINGCNNNYDYRLTSNENYLNFQETNCEIAYEHEVEYAVDLFVNGGDQDILGLEFDLNFAGSELNGCLDQTFNHYVDENMLAADLWNSCLCTHADCDYYCDL